uniref:Uncharacterized protein n=1 Tax=Plectus sambesii TaxID=2011161 RepID=A0A914WE39_9BILA
MPQDRQPCRYREETRAAKGIAVSVCCPDKIRPTRPLSPVSRLTPQRTSDLAQAAQVRSSTCAAPVNNRLNQAPPTSHWSTPDDPACLKWRHTFPPSQNNQIPTFAPFVSFTLETVIL